MSETTERVHMNSIDVHKVNKLDPSIQHTSLCLKQDVLTLEESDLSLLFHNNLLHLELKFSSTEKGISKAFLTRLRNSTSIKSVFWYLNKKAESCRLELLVYRTPLSMNLKYLLIYGREMAERDMSLMKKALQKNQCLECFKIWGVEYGSSSLCKGLVIKLREISFDFSGEDDQEDALLFALLLMRGDVQGEFVELSLTINDCVDKQSNRIRFIVAAIEKHVAMIDSSTASLWQVTRRHNSNPVADYIISILKQKLVKLPILSE